MKPFAQLLFFVCNFGMDGLALGQLVVPWRCYLSSYLLFYYGIMKTIKAIINRNLIRICLSSIVCLALGVVFSAEAKRANMIVIFTDDQGYADLSCQGALKDVNTPNIDALAEDGVRFTSGYITAPQCVPSRAGIMSGRYQARFGVDDNTLGPLPLSEKLIPERLQAAGYVTGMVGKWHLDPNHSQTEWIEKNMPGAAQDANRKVRVPHAKARPYLPDVRGFTDCFSGLVNTYWATYDLDGSDIKPARKVKRDGFRLDIQTDAALAFIERHAEEPFFLYLAYFAPHVPLEATPKYLERFPGEMPERRRTALAMLSAIDDGVGRIRQRLKDHGIDKDTLIFFMSDNGAPLKLIMEDKPLSARGAAWDGSRNDPWVGEKAMLTEGGIRVPFVASWPGTVPEGKVFHFPVSTLDVSATALALAGQDPVPELDGVDLVPYLTGVKKGVPHKALCWRFWNQAAIRKGKWKYLQVGDHRFLFDLSSDKHENDNLIEKHSLLAKELQGELQAWCIGLKKPGMPSGEVRREKSFYEHYLGLGKPEMQLSEKNMFIDNGQIRLGVDMESGGSIFYFSESKKERNLLNHHDRGRFVQQSYYGDEDGSMWAGKNWRWNPVQGGDYKGRPAKVLEHKSSEKSLYVKSVPVHWATGLDITDSTMEQWITLSGDIAHIRYRFTYQGKKAHKPRHQEMPAVFVDYALPNLVFYNGKKPWRNDKVARVVPGWPNERHKTTEHWAAFVDDKDWGVGVYTPGTSVMTCYRYKGKPGPKGSGCSYFSPIRTLAIKNGTVLEYDVYLTIGNVVQIRSRFKKIYRLKYYKGGNNESK